MPSADRRAPAAPAPGRVRVEGHGRLDLDSGWEVASCRPDSCAAPEDTAGLDWTAAEVPGTAAGALRRAGSWDYADERDFDASDWWFRTGFEAPPPAAEERVLLRLDGVATFHEVFLNGERIAAGESMFATAAVDLGGRLREGANELAIRCLALNERLGAKRRPRARWRTRLADNRLRFVRTMLLGRCPGFAPGPAAVGPWRPVWIERRRAIEVSGLELRPRVEGADGVLAVAATVRGIGAFEVAAADLLVGDADEVSASLTVVPGEDGAVELRGEARVPQARLWWPHTHGDPALHRVRVRLAGPDGELGIEVGPIGFRDLRPGPGDDHDVLEDGLDLHLNGVRVFARGAVWTPDDFVGMAPDRERLRAALERVRGAGMNMVRIPGTGAYESSDFHDLCDELGILVWQDLAFANFDYPIADEGFRAAVEAEAGEQLAALAGRPSFVVACGNSEVEQQVAMLGLDPEIGRGPLFGEILPGALEASGADAIYVPSAPCGGARPFLPGKGIAHYFGVGGYRRPLSDARLAGVRFAAECLAFANVPDEAGVEAILPGAPLDVVVHHPRWKAGVPRDAGTGWDFDDVRDHYLREIFGIEAAELRRYDHERYLELSRAVSAEAMKAVFGEWRRAGSPCGGGLVLWLRDLVPGAGWGLVDHSGAPKEALRGLAEVLAPLAVWITDEGQAGVAVHVADERPEPLRARLRVALYADSSRPVGEATRAIEIPARGNATFDFESLLGGFRDVSWAYRFGPPAQDLLVASLERDGEGKEVLAQAFHFPVGPPTGAETPAELGFGGEVVPGPDGRRLLRLSSRRLVYGLTLRAGGSSRAAGRELHLEPGRDRFVELSSTQAEEGKVVATAVNMAGNVSIAVDGS